MLILCFYSFNDYFKLKKVSCSGVLYNVSFIDFDWMVPAATISAVTVQLTDTTAKRVS